MARTSTAISRRDALGRLVGGSLGWSLLARGALRAAPLPTQPTTGAPAKAVIQIWLWGGPCHLDTFDPKPQAGRDWTGPLASPIGTKTAGLQISESLPLLAQQSEHYAVVRSLTHGSNSHETAAYEVQTGHKPGEQLVFPTLGALVGLRRGYDHGYSGLIPPYVVLTKPQGRFSEAGFLGPSYKPFCTGGDPNARRFTVEGVISERVSDERQVRRRQLLAKLDSLGAALGDDPAFGALAASEQAAYDLILGDGAKLFDLNQEPTALRDQYGRNMFGQSCLMARRLIEAGVPYVTINYSGWDTHKKHFEEMRRKLPELDAGLASLLADLRERGLLDTTVVWCGGEFGRTPKVLWEAPWYGGRGHWGAVFSGLLAGGGFRGGRVLGASDARGEAVAERPVEPTELLGAILQRLGIDPDAPLANPRELPVTLMPGRPGQTRLPELL